MIKLKSEINNRESRATLSRDIIYKTAGNICGFYYIA